MNAGAVAAAQGQPAIGPGHPGRLDLDFGQALEQGAVLFGGGQGAGQGGHVPRSANHRNSLEALFLGLTQALAHKRLPLGFSQLLGICRGGRIHRGQRAIAL